jgi:hypothetical protein
VISEASSKLSYTAATMLANSLVMPLSATKTEQVMLTPSLSELCELVGLWVVSAIFARVGGVGYCGSVQAILKGQLQSTQRNVYFERVYRIEIKK